MAISHHSPARNRQSRDRKGADALRHQNRGLQSRDRKGADALRNQNRDLQNRDRKGADALRIARPRPPNPRSPRKLPPCKPQDNACSKLAGTETSWCRSLFFTTTAFLRSLSEVYTFGNATKYCRSGILAPCRLVADPRARPSGARLVPNLFRNHQK